MLILLSAEIDLHRVDISGTQYGSHLTILLLRMATEEDQARMIKALMGHMVTVKGTKYGKVLLRHMQA